MATSRHLAAGFKKRLERYRALHPELSEVALLEKVKASYRAKTPEAKARQQAGLLSGNPKATRHGKKPATTKAAVRMDDLRGLDILTFARDLCHLKLHPAQRVILAALYGLPIAPQDMPLYEILTGGASVQHGLNLEAVEAVLCLGARSGKSMLLSIVATYECIVRGQHWRQSLRKGEIGYAVLVATRLQQAQDIAQGNAGRMVADSPELRGYLAQEPTQTRIEFKNSLTIMSLPCNSTAGRGLPIFLLGFDEVAHFYTEGARADVDIYNSLSPRLAQFRGAKTILASTPAAKQGLFWRWFSEGFSVPGRATFQGATAVVNPQVDAEYLERVRARDVDNYEREFLAQFAERLQSYFAADTIDAALCLPAQQPPRPGLTYCLGIDQSGLSGRDRFAAAVAHCEDDGSVTLDALCSWDARDLDSILHELQALAKAYSLTTALVDAYAAGWVTSALSRIGLSCERRPGLPAVYANTKSLLISGRLRAPDNGELRGGLLNTTAFYGRNNALSIAHERTREGHGDLADAACTAVWAASGSPDLLDVAFSDADIREAFTAGETFYAAA